MLARLKIIFESSTQADMVLHLFVEVCCFVSIYAFISQDHNWIISLASGLVFPNCLSQVIHLFLPLVQVFTFTHPNYSSNKSNHRYKKLQFEIPSNTGSAMVHGIS